MTVELAGDLSLVVLMLLTLIWCMLLLRKLRHINLDRRDIADLIAGIDAATRRAELAITGIREAARDAQATLGKEREQVDARAADLARLAEGGSQMARRLETILQGGARSLAELQLAREPGRTASRVPVAPAAGAKPAPAPRAFSPAVGDRAPRPADGALLKALEGLR